MTLPDEKYVYVELFPADENYRPVLGVQPERTLIEDKTEEQVHRDIREGAIEKGQFVPEYSTNPEVTPGYTEPKEDVLQTKSN